MQKTPDGSKFEDATDNSFRVAIFTIESQTFS